MKTPRQREDAYRVAVAAWLNDLIGEKGANQNDVADAGGVSHSTISRARNLKNSIDPRSVHAISAHFKHPLSDALTLALSAPKAPPKKASANRKKLEKFITEAESMPADERAELIEALQRLAG